MIVIIDPISVFYIGDAYNFAYKLDYFKECQNTLAYPEPIVSAKITK